MEFEINDHKELPQETDINTSELIKAINTVKKYREQLRRVLECIKGEFDFETFLSEYFTNDNFERLQDNYECEIFVDMRTKRVILANRFDKRIKESVKLLSGQKWFEWLDKRKIKGQVEIV